MSIGWNNLLDNINKLHTRELGHQRIQNNIKLEYDDVIEYCKEVLLNKKCIINLKGKNWYVLHTYIMITINAYSFTMINEHKNYNNYFKQNILKTTPGLK